MSQRTLFMLHAPLAAALLVVHYYAFQHDLYWHYFWFDIPMHFIGGLWAGLASVWFLRFISSRPSFVSVILGVLAIGIAWEIMEYVVGFQREENHLFDTSLDLIMDTLGGICGFFIVRKMVQSTTNGSSENNPSESRNATA